MDYDFKSLSDYDFELLVCDLLSAEWGRVIEGFRRGRDQGIDLRCAVEEGSGAVIQCKHYANTPFSGLCAAVKREVPKLVRLAPARYLLVTSRFLTPAEKDTLLALLTPYCLSAGDILGGSELNALLRRHPQVEQTHYKLWLTSAAVMEKILHSALYRQSAMLREEIRGKLRLYVQSAAAYNKARETLRRQNCCIISGIPGIGKTTLAEILLICYLDQGYEIIKIRSDVREAIELYHPERKQVFFYDDFLGSTALEIRDNRNEKEELLSFLSHIARDRGKKFILTTREYILNQARQTCEAFSREDFDYRKCIISLEDYTRENRARILYNHLYFYRAGREDIEALLQDDRVIRIVDHPNYSPRLIETVLKLRHTAGEEDFYQFFAHMLDHPDKLWEHAFQRQISPAARDLLLLLYPASGGASIPYLQKHYEEYHRIKSRRENRPLRATDFMDALRETVGTFIKIDGKYVFYHNPSVEDFIHGYIAENDAEFRMLCEAAMDFNYCLQMARLDQELCLRCQDDFTAALRRTMDTGLSGRRDIALVRQIKRLTAVNWYLALPEAREIIQEKVDCLLDILEAACGDMSDENCHEGVDLSDLRGLLEELDFFALKEETRERLYDVLLQYGLAWCRWDFSYTIDDLLLFPALGDIRPISLKGEKFRPVYELIKDFQDEYAHWYIREMEHESDCDDCIVDLGRIERCFHISLYDVREQVEEQRRRIREREEIGGEDDPTAAVPPVPDLCDAEITSMFQSLLDRGQDDGSSLEKTERTV